MKRKPIWIGLVCIAMVAALALFWRGDDKTRVERLVLRNTEELEKIALLMQSGPLAKLPSFSGIQQITADPSTHTVKFDISAWGIGFGIIMKCIFSLCNNRCRGRLSRPETDKISPAITRAFICAHSIPEKPSSLVHTHAKPTLPRPCATLRLVYLG